MYILYIYMYIYIYYIYRYYTCRYEFRYLKSYITTICVSLKTLPAIASTPSKTTLPPGVLDGQHLSTDNQQIEDKPRAKSPLKK